MLIWQVVSGKIPPAIFMSMTFFEDMENKSRKNIQIYKYWKL